MPTQPCPPESSSVIWRYMDDWKFADTLGTFSEHDQWFDETGTNTRHFNDPGQLWFSHPWAHAEGAGGEGTFPDANTDVDTFCERIVNARQLADDQVLALKKILNGVDPGTLRDAIFHLGQLCGVSCWHQNPTETEDMWNCIENDNGVAIKTTVGALEHALAWAHNSPARFARPSVCKVGYINHASGFLEYDGFRCLLSVVDQHWSDENEVRVVAKSFRFNSIPMQFSVNDTEPDTLGGVLTPLSIDEISDHVRHVANAAKTEYGAIRGKAVKGFHLPIGLDGLIDEVVISPEADSSYFDTVTALLANTGLREVPISKSVYGGHRYD